LGIVQIALVAAVAREAEESEASEGGVMLRLGNDIEELAADFAAGVCLAVDIDVPIAVAELVLLLGYCESADAVDELDGEIDCAGTAIVIGIVEAFTWTGTSRESEKVVEDACGIIDVSRAMDVDAGEVA
jgi:hypothetical protein